MQVQDAATGGPGQTHRETLPTDPGQTGLVGTRSLDMQCFNPFDLGHSLVEEQDRVPQAVPHNVAIAALRAQIRRRAAAKVVLGQRISRGPARRQDLGRDEFCDGRDGVVRERARGKVGRGWREKDCGTLRRRRRRPGRGRDDGNGDRGRHHATLARRGVGELRLAVYAEVGQA